MSVFVGSLYLEGCLRNYHFVVVSVADPECFAVAAPRRNILVRSWGRVLFHVPLHPLRVRFPVAEPKTRAFGSSSVKAGSRVVGGFIVDEIYGKREPLSLWHGVADY